jgi:ABC-2 type transport system ATP-binding protein
MIEARNLSKRYGGKLAVDHLSFTVTPGKVTGFLGPNGAGKSTTMRLLVGLDRPETGHASIGGRPYRDLADPLRTVGVLLEAKAAHRGRTARNHLLCLAQTQGLPPERVDQVISMAGLSAVASRRAGRFSLGMGQRLGIAAALLGDPGVLILDEPVNGLDPEGVLWIRNLMKRLAADGRTVLVSSHLMNEMAVTADHLIVIGQGRLLADCPTAEFIDCNSKPQVLVKTSGAAQLAQLVTSEGAQVRRNGTDVLTVTGVPAPRIAELAAAARIVVYELTPQRASLEEAFLEMTAGSLEFGAYGSSVRGGATTSQYSRSTS